MAVDVIGSVGSSSMHTAPRNDFDNQVREEAHEHIRRYKNQIFLPDQSKSRGSPENGEY
jgi:hypothetical protein